MTTDTLTPSDYTLGTNPAERARLQGPADDLAAHTLALLDHADLPVGGRALELGCGPAGSIALLADRVGPTGSLTAVDIDAAQVALARKLVADRGLGHVEVLQGDARATTLLSGSFDVVHARLLLVNIPRPDQVVAEMVRLVKPGGWVIVDEADGGARVCYPPLEAFDQLAAVFHAAYRSDGAGGGVMRAVVTGASARFRPAFASRPAESRPLLPIVAGRPAEGCRRHG